MKIAILIIYTAAIGFIFLYSMVQIHLSILYLRERNKRKRLALQNPNGKENVLPEDLPFVTVQLPVYNELYVVERLIKSIAAFNYPKDKFEIQVLDDSNDETVQIIDKVVEEVKATGIDISAVRRTNRVGFKAGALEYGLEKAKGNLIAIFDADFVPHPEFLLDTVSHFDNDNVGVVQTRWKHLNEEYSILTKLQAFGLDAHFSVEQRGRNSKNFFINFNGTAGVWRKECIKDAGGWQHDTLTEDLDLSYRAQLKGWKFKYLEEIGTPAELPAQINALKSQQYRWTKGAAENARKNLGNVMKADLPFPKKLHAFFHLANSIIFICIVVVSVLSIPLLVLKSNSPALDRYFLFASFTVLSFVSLGVFYFVSYISKSDNPLIDFFKFFLKFPLFLSMSMGISLHNAVAVVQGLRGKQSPFIRTPKFNITGLTGNFKHSKYQMSKLTWLSMFEGLLAVYFASGIYLAVRYDDFGLFPFHVMLTLGFGMVFFYSVKHSVLAK
ncbi:MAG: glycosyltransferase [Bacteroidia bacterium]|nr:glycosyltransferase [Bacteroidia bacterium]